MSKTKKLTAKQRRFVEEFLLDLNATAAAKRAGYSDKTAGQQGHRLLKNVEIQRQLTEAAEKRSERVGISAEWVLQQAVEVYKRCMQVAPVLDRKGNQVYVEGPDGDEVPAFMFQHAGANRALELVGRHTTVQAFNDKVLVEVVDRAAILGRARERARGKEK